MAGRGPDRTGDGVFAIVIIIMLLIEMDEDIPANDTTIIVVNIIVEPKRSSNVCTIR